MRYVPILQARRGELTALFQLPARIWFHIAPVLEVPPIPHDWAVDEPKKTLDRHLSDLCTSLKRTMPSNRSFFLDLPNLEPLGEPIGGKHPVAATFERCAQLGLTAVPTLALDRDTQYVEAVRQVVTEGRGACIRLSVDGEDDAIDEQLMAVCARLGLGPADVDLIIDVGAVENRSATNYSRGLIPFIASAMVQARAWRSRTLCAGAFPASMANVEVGETLIPRADWALWNRVHNGLALAARSLDYGDYGIQAPGLEEVDPRVMKLSANIRYTSTTEWLVLKGRTLRVAGYEEYQRLARTLRGRPEYRGADFSPGDAYIDQCAEGMETPGTPEIWRRNGTSHHLAHVVDQLHAIADV